MTSLGLVKVVILRYIIRHEISFISFFHCPSRSPSSLFHAIINHAIYSPHFQWPLYVAKLPLWWFSVIFSSVDATPICLRIQSFHILYFLVWSHIYLNILFLLFSLLSCLYKVQRSLPQSIARCITVWKNFPLNLVSILRPQTTSDTFILSNHPACIRLNTGKHCTAFPVSLFNKIQNSCKWNMLINWILE